MQSNFYISRDKTKLDVNFIHNYLSEQSYWAKGRTLEKVKLSIENSLCFGVYDNDNTQVGFARIATDFVTVAWLMDVFIDEQYQGKGLGKLLIEFIVNLPEMKEVSGIGLKTLDAQNLYKQFGFDNIDNPEIWMMKKNI
ncbi:N-acetylglutamate synthase-like GNAT family acetyltransferase [Saonia flava]|uniref:N-acetylglutamate synthase-like GNAT family acetyltransferase n=1 Tax=Saonia flava TaxID=523696 RepID=A0A846QW35_9FLAO|nr:GNAT family N-acetyltransferase [Saonia flava]NJB69785.1 N-acetylglutamate synthase-like GNAT family acetyltransferase [Saonia flava]